MLSNIHIRLLPILLLAASFLLPQFAFAGSQTFTTPGTYSFTVPAYSSLSVTVDGAGGPMASQYICGGGEDICLSESHSGGPSSFNDSVMGYGGHPPRLTEYCQWESAEPGDASGGDSNTAGGGSPGGSVDSDSYCAHGGSAGGRAVKTYVPGHLTPGSAVQVVVGEGGESVTNGSSGSAPAGIVTITWVDPAPTCSVTLSPNPVNRGNSSTLSWSSTYTTSFYINNVGYVGTSGSTSVAPNSTTDYSGSVSGAGGSNTCAASLTVYQYCPFNGTNIAHGSSVTAYQSTSVPFGNSCVAETRTCSDGTLSGSYAYSSCSVTAPASCSFNGTTVAHGSSVTAYQSTSVPYGSSCTSESRSCYNGSLSGSYQYNSCAVTAPANCTFNGATVTHGSSVTAYQASTVPYGQSCVSQSRSCSNGSLSGSYTYNSCTVSAPPTPTASVALSANPINRGSSSTVSWSSTDTTSCTGTNFSTGGATSGAVSVSPTTNTIYSVSCTGAGGTATDSKTLTVNQQTASLTLGASTIANGGSTSLTWSSQYASSCTGTNFSTGGATSGTVTVSPTSNTTYTVTCGVGSDSKTLTVAQPPTATITADSASIKVGESTTIRASFTVGANDTLSAVAIDSPAGTHLTTTSVGSKTYTFTPSAAGTYTFYARATTQYFSSWATYDSVTVTVTNPAPTCTINASPGSYNAPGSSTLSWTSTNATSFHISGIGYVTAPGSTTVFPSESTTYNGTVSGPGGGGSCSRTLTVNRSCTFNGQTVTHGNSVTAYREASVPFGSTCQSEMRTCHDGNLTGTFAYGSCSVVAPADCTLDGVTVAHGASRTFYSQQTAPSGTVCSSLIQSRTCTNGTLSGSDTYQYASCSCTPAYTCAGQTIRYTDASCQTSSVTTCIAPTFCSTGSAACLYPPVEFAEGGHLSVQPELIPEGLPVHVAWNVSNVSSCTATGTNGDSWTIAGTAANGWTSATPDGGETTGPIMEQTTYTLNCTGLDGTHTPAESVTVNVIPIFIEV